MESHVKYRTQALIKKICSGEYYSTDVEVLLIRIREYIKQGSFIRELGDFVAHPIRSRGITFTALNLLYYNFKYLEDFVFQKRNVDVSLFPSYLKDYLYVLIDTITPGELGKMKMKKKDLLSTLRKIETNSLIKAGYIKIPTTKDIENIVFILNNRQHPKVYNQEQIINDLIYEIRGLGLEVSEEHFLNQSDRLMLCFFDLINKSKIEFITGDRGWLEIGSTHGNKGSAGNLMMCASVPITNSLNKAQLQFIRTNMKTSDYVDHDMFTSNFYPKYSSLNIDWSGSYCIDFGDNKIKLDLV